MSARLVPPRAAWARLRDMRQVVVEQPAVAHAVRCLPLYDVLELTLELVRQHDWPEFSEPEPLPPNVSRFRPRVRHGDTSGGWPGGGSSLRCAGAFVTFPHSGVTRQIPARLICRAYSALISSALTLRCSGLVSRRTGSRLPQDGLRSGCGRARSGHAQYHHVARGTLIQSAVLWTA